MKDESKEYTIGNFVHAYFLTIREEIKESKSRKYQAVTTGIIWIPIISALAEKLETQWVWLFIPSLILGIVLLETGENNSIYRARNYIKKQIEENINKSNGWETWIGWETWLDEGTKNGDEIRSSDRNTHIGLLIIFIFYYFVPAIAGIYWLFNSLKTCSYLSEYKEIIACALGFIYFILFIMVAIPYNKSYKCLWQSSPEEKEQSN